MNRVSFDTFRYFIESLKVWKKPKYISWTNKYQNLVFSFLTVTHILLLPTI